MSKQTEATKEIERSVFGEGKLQEQQREFRASRLGAAALAPGYAILTEFRTEGGTTYTRKNAAADMVLTGQKPDDPRLDKFALATINRASYLMEIMTAPLFAGLYYCAQETLPKLRDALIECQIAASDCNAAAKELKSKRETRILIYPSFLDTSNVEMGHRFAEITHRRLLILRKAYQGNATVYRNAFAPLKNSWQALVGKQREVLQIALNSGEEQRSNGIMIFHAGGRRNTGDLKKTYPDQKKIPDVDYKPIDAAIAMFESAKDWSITRKVGPT